MRTRLPASMIEYTVADMQIGDTGFLTHWSMHIDHGRYGYLNPGSTVHHTPGGTVSMRVTRMASGFEVVVQPDQKFRPSVIDKGWLEVKTIRVG